MSVIGLFFRDRPWLPWQRNLGHNWL